jgi:hypothetical protein
MLGELGVTAMEEIVGAVAVTARLAVPLMPLSAAVMVDEPAATPVARPEALIVATEVFEEVHVTDVVTLPVVPLL